MAPAYYDHEQAYRRIAAAGGRGWDDLAPGQNPGSYEALDAFLASPFVPRAGRALDLGCGGGQAALKLAARGFDVVGVDYSETAIALARQNAVAAGLHVTFQVRDALAPPAGEFELVIDNHLLHCLLGADRGVLLANAFRALAPGGLLFSDTMSAEGDFSPAAMAADPLSRRALNGHRFWVTEQEFRAELEAAGFVVDHLERRANEPGVGDMLTVYARRP